jgi:PAS domain S-box-containing protein
MKRKISGTNDPIDDVDRFVTLRKFPFLNDQVKNALEQFIEMSANIFNVSVCLLELIDEQYVYFNSISSAKDELWINRNTCLNELTKHKPSVTFFEDISAEYLLNLNPTLIGDINLKFYAGAPLITTEGFIIGTLSISDSAARLFKVSDQQILASLAQNVINYVEISLSELKISSDQTTYNFTAIRKYSDVGLKSFGETIDKQLIEKLNEDLNALNEELLSSNNELVLANDNLQRSQSNLLQANALLADSEELQAIAIGHAQLGIWHIDAATRQFKPSVQLKEFVGYFPDEELSLSALLIQIREDYRSVVSSLVDQAISLGIPFETELPLIEFRTKKLRWLRATGKLNIEKHGRAAYFSGTVTDITEHKLDEQRKNDFISMVSHELKTPLTSMNGFIQLLLSKAKKVNDEFSLGILERANKQARKMIIMIDGFLNMKRLETGKIPLNLSLFDMAELVKEIKEELSATIFTHLIVFAPVEYTSLEADRDKISLIISNLISNALKYSPRGSTINVACVSVASNVCVSVSDQGMGISKEDARQLFDRFYRVDSAQMQNINGFGIGLYLCDEIIRRHQGAISVESVVGKGSVFTFTLPLRQGS